MFSRIPLLICHYLGLLEECQVASLRRKPATDCGVESIKQSY